ncbi:hypothetical protein [Pseudanabaena sp. 'Roaring Creek']|nr:hypothetical protein [Pseudanabaena sp. 'Roaring Creek']
MPCYIKTCIAPDRSRSISIAIDITGKCDRYHGIDFEPLQTSSSQNP